MGIISIGFLVLISLMGGIVAVFADNLGRKIGKKRLKLHHRIRPRHTATLFVFGSGVLIPILTISIAAGLSKDFRKWITEGEKAIQEVIDLRGQRQKLVSENESLSKDNSQKTSEVRTAEARLAELRPKLSNLTKDVQSLQQRTLDLRTKLDSAQSKLRASHAKLLQNASLLNLSASQKSKLLADYKEIDRQIREAFEYQRQLINDIEKNQKVITTLKGETARLESDRTQLEGQINTLKEQYAKDLEKKESELKAMQKQLEEGEAELARVSNDIRSLTAFNDQTRQKMLIYGIGFEVARLIAPADSTMLQARNLLNSLLRTARVVAESRGAKGTARVPAASIWDQEIGGRNVSADEQMSQIVAKIAGVPESRILVATAFWNSYLGEPVPLSITAFPNKKCFASGAVIGETRIKGDAPAAEVIRQLSNWLGTAVRDAALKAGMVPIAGQENALATISPAQVFDAVDQIRAANRTVRVQAIATQDIYASDSLQLEFRIR